MFKLLERFRTSLGEGRFWMLIGVLVTTGIASFALAITDYENTLTLQTVLALAGIVGAGLIIGTRLSAEKRRYWLAIIAPAIGIVLIGLLFFPQYWMAAMGAASGWIVAGIMIFGRQNAPMQYQVAVKAMRKQNYKDAVSAMDELIKIEPDNPAHYRLRGRILRLWGKTGRARRDYESMIEYSTNDGIKAEAYNELSELELQSKNYEQALSAAKNASELLPNDWVAAYNLGMIQDRLGQSEEVIESLNRALASNIEDSRHRLLIYTWLLRAYTRLGQSEKASEYHQKLKAENKSLAEWQEMLESDDAAVLRSVVGDDVQLAKQLINDEIDPMQVASTKVQGKA